MDYGFFKRSDGQTELKNKTHPYMTHFKYKDTDKLKAFAAMSFHFTPSRMAIIKTTHSNKLVRMWKNGLSFTTGGNVKWHGCFGNSPVLQKAKHRVTT